MTQTQGPLIEARPKGRLEPRLSPRTRRLVELLVEAEFQARKPRPKRPPKGQAATDQQPEPAQTPSIASLSIHAGYADTDSGRSAARRDVAAPQARAYRSQLRYLALDDAFGSIVGNIASIAMGNSSSDKAQIEAFAQLVVYQQAHVPKGEQAVMVVDYEVSEQGADDRIAISVNRPQGPEVMPPHEDPGSGKAGGSVGAGSALTSDLTMVTYDEAAGVSIEAWQRLIAEMPSPGELFPPGPASREASEGPDLVTILRGAGYEVVEGAEAVLAAVNGEVRPDAD